MGQAAEAEELLEVLGHELRTVVADDRRILAGKLLPCPLHDDFRLALLQRRADFPVDEEAAAAVDETALVIEGPRDVDVGDIDMPVLVGAQRLDEALALGRSLERTEIEPARGLENAVNAGGTAGGDVGVEHHEGQPAVALQGKEFLEVEDRLLLVGFEPVVTRDPGIVFVGLAIALLPGMPLAGMEADPEQEGGDYNAGFVGPGVDKIDDGVACIVGNPDAAQGSPSAFFKRTYSSMTSERTSCLRWSLSWRWAIC